MGTSGPTGRAGTGGHRGTPGGCRHQDSSSSLSTGAGDPMDVAVMNDSVAVKRNTSENMILSYF